MRWIDLSVSAPAETLKQMLSERKIPTENLCDRKLGTPLMHLRLRGERVRVRCELTGRPTKDNGFIQGTAFYGRITERAQMCRVRGIIVTEPVFHLCFLALFIGFLFRCVSLGGFSVVPLCLAVFVFFLFRTEYKKQGILLRYLRRVACLCEEVQKKESGG